MASAETKHTPGPWTIRVATASIPTIHVSSERGHFASVFGARHVQDARLIAAAPDMLATLRTHENRLSQCAARGERAKPTTAELNDMLADFRAAIAKAEGR